MSVRAEMVRAGLRWLIKHRNHRELTVEQHRRFATVAERLVPDPPPHTRTLPVDADGVRADLIATPAFEGDRHVLFLHGGAFIIGANGIIDLGLRLNALSGKQVGEILTLNRTIGAQAAVKEGYEAITAKLKPYQNSRIDQVGPTDSQTDSYAVSARDCAEFMGRHQRELQLFHNQTEQQSRETAAEMEIISEEAAGGPMRTKAQLLARGCD